MKPELQVMLEGEGKGESEQSWASDLGEDKGMRVARG